MAQLFARVKAGAKGEPLLWGFLGLVLGCVALSAAWYTPFPMLIPFGIIVLAVAVYDLRFALLCCAAVIPLSSEFYLGSFSMDLPSEPLMLLLLGLGVLYVLVRIKHVEAAFLRHPVSLLIILHLCWILVATLNSSNQVTSIKYFLAKLWYVVPFYVLGGLLLRRSFDLQRLILFLAFPMTLVLTWCLVRHASLGFTFASVNKAMAPFFRNHVSYAAITSILLPFFIVGAREFKRGSKRRFFLSLLSFLSIVAVYTSYTRAAFVSLFIGLGFVYVIKYRLTKFALAGFAVFLIGFSVFVVSQNRFFGFAPDYDKTNTHKDFSNLLTATYKLEDISTMERVHRWVAGAYMSAERPLVGWGPGNFYENYQGYTLESFKTYVSDNPDKSGIHNYLLMVLVDQGYFGLLIFAFLCCFGLLTAERAYLRAETPAERRAVIMLAASLAINLSFQLINDMLEADKSGPWFFLSLALLVNLDLRGRLKEVWDERPTLTTTS